MKRNNHWLFFIASSLSLFLVSCNKPLDILGPRDKPDLASVKWDSIQVVYWVYTTDSSKEVKRTFTITEPSDMKKLRSMITVKEVSGLSTGTGNQLILKNRKNDVWHGNFCFEDTLHMSLTKDAWRSYRFVLSGLGFYNELRELCSQNEKQYHPEAMPEHIKLRSNLVYDYPKLETKGKP